MDPGAADLRKKAPDAVQLELATETAQCDDTTPMPLLEEKCVYVSKEDVFQQALQNLSIKVHEPKACTVGNDQVIGSVCIDVPAHGKYPVLHQRKFFGDYKMTEHDALESAKLAALVYLQKTGIIYVDDINLGELRKRETELADCQYKLLAASSWATSFQESTESLKAELAIAHDENKKLVEAAKAFEVKKEVPPTQPFNLKIEPPTYQGFEIMKEMSTPPPSNTKAGTSLEHREKQRSLHSTRIRRTLFKENSAGGPTDQRTDDVEKMT